MEVVFFQSAGGGSLLKFAPTAARLLPGRAALTYKRSARCWFTLKHAAQRFYNRGGHTNDHNTTPAPLLLPNFGFTLTFWEQLFQETLAFKQNQSWHKGVFASTTALFSMKEGVRQQIWGKEMSATVLSAFYDMDMLYKDKSMNMNALHINSMLDKKAVGAPVTTPGSGGSFAPGFFRRNSTSNLEAMNNGNKYPLSSYSSLKENSPTCNSSATALMNKENKFRDRAFSESAERGVLQPKAGSQINSTRYKTELCRPFEENGSCKYGEKCQFAHGYHELRSLSRHPKYKTEPCRTFHTIGFCPYGPRCHFIHNADERRPSPAGNANAQSSEPRCGYGQRDMMPPQQLFTQRDRPKLHHSLSFSGFSTHHGLESPLLDSPTSRTPPPQNSASSSASSFYEEALSPSSCINSAFNFPGQDLKALLAPLAVHTSGYNSGAYYGNMPGSVCPPSPPPSYNMSHLQALRRLNESPVFEPPPSPPDSLSDRESYASGSLSSSGSLSGSESPSLDAGRRLPIFSRLSISDD